MRINVNEKEGSKAIDKLIELTSELKETNKKIDKIILQLEEEGIFD